MARGRGRARWIHTRYPCYCAGCGNSLDVGTSAFYMPSTKQVFGDEGCCTGSREQSEQHNPPNEDRECATDYQLDDEMVYNYGTGRAY